MKENGRQDCDLNDDTVHSNGAEESCPLSHEERRRRRRRAGLVVCASLYTFLMVGAIFGWGPMQLLLEKNGSFSSKCTTEETKQNEICPAQSAALVSVQFYAITTQLVSPFLGQVADRFGAATLACIMAVCSWTGLTLLVLAAEYADWLLYVAFIFVGLSTWSGGILTVQTGMVYAGHTRSRVIFVLNALFDAGSVTYLGLWGIGEWTGASLTAISGGYLGVSVATFGTGLYFWAVATSEGEEHTQLPPFQRDVHVDIDESLPTTEASNGTNLNHGHIGCSPDLSEECRDSSIQPPAIEIEGTLQGSKRYIIVAERTSRQQLTSWPFFLVVIIWAIQVTANMWTLTTTRDFLAYLGDDEVGNKYLTVFTLSMPASLAALPFTDAMVRHFGFHGGFQGINALALGYNLIRLLSDSLNVQIVGFILFSFFRSFFFGVTFSFLPELFAPTVVGKASGILFAITGALSFLNVPLASYAIEEQGGDFFVPNLIYTVLVLPCIAAAWGIRQVICREQAAKEEISEARLRASYGGVLLRN